MKTIGIIIFLLGVIIIGSELSGYSPEILDWLTQWGKSVGWGLKVTIVIIGATLYLISSSFE